MSASPLLGGVTVLDLASVGPAARASRWLADYGASVIKVGPVPANAGVQIVPPAYAYGAHRGMQRAMLDLKAPAGRDAFLRLVAEADVVIESFRPGVIDKLGIAYDDLAAVNPGIVLCSTTGFGQTGPRSQWAGHDINYLAVAGYLHCSGRDQHGAPALPGATVADSAAGGMQAVASICAALVRRGVTGEGTHLDVSIADGALSLMSLNVDEYFADGVEPGPRHGLLTGRYACYDIYEAGDAKHIAVGAIESRFYRNLCAALGCEQWADHQYDDDVQDQVRADFAAAFATRSRDDWVDELGPADTCVSGVLTIPEITEDDQFLARGVFADVEHPTAGSLRQTGALFAGQGDATQMDVPDMAVSSTAELLQGVGMAEAEVEELLKSGAAA